MMFRSNNPPTDDAAELFDRITSDVYDAIDLIGAQVADDLQQRISVPVEFVPGPGGAVFTIRSLPGEPPRMETQTLHDSIQSEMDVDQQVIGVEVSSDVFYAPMLEYGEHVAARPAWLPTFNDHVEDFFDAVVAAVSH